MADEPGLNGTAAAWGDIRPYELLLWAQTAIWPGLSKEDRQKYNYMLTRFYKEFARMPEARELIAWLRGLPKVRGGGALAPASRRDYYECIRHLYRRAIAEYPPARNLPLLPYESFRGRRWTYRPEA